MDGTGAGCRADGDRDGVRGAGPAYERLRKIADELKSEMENNSDKKINDLYNPRVQGDEHQRSEHSKKNNIGVR